MCERHDPGGGCYEELELQVGPETGIGGWQPRRSWQDSLCAAPFVGLWELVSDIRHDRLGPADWIFIVIVLAILT